MIQLECLDSQIENYLTPTITNPSITFIHKEGILRLTMNHDQLNALRAMLMVADDSPRSILIKNPTSNQWSYNVSGVSVDYQGYGNMKYERSGMSTSTVAKVKSNDINIITSIYHFDVSPYEHEDYNDPPYYFYNDESQVAIHLNKTQVEKAAGLLYRIFPYERFESINMRVYDYIKEEIK